MNNEIIIEWLEFFGEPSSKLNEVDICDDGSMWLGLTQIAPKGTA